MKGGIIMNDVMKNGFTELSYEEIVNTNGGFGIGAVLTIASWTVWLIFNTPSVCY